MMTTTYNFPNKLEGDEGWYDGFEPHKVDLSSLKRKSMLQLRARAWTLHQYQTFSQDVVCGLMFWCAGGEKPTHIHSRPDAQLSFFYLWWCGDSPFGTQFASEIQRRSEIEKGSVSETCHHMDRVGRK